MTNIRDFLKLRRAPRLIDPGEWPERSGKARVLVENRDRAELFARADVLRDAGYDVATCTGPSEGGHHPAHCPLLEGEHCALVDGADVVMSTCQLAESHGILAALGRPGSPPVVFAAPKPELGNYADVAGDAKLIPIPLTEKGLLDALAEARTQGAGRG